MDCLKIFRARVAKDRLLADAAALDDIDSEVLGLIDDAVREARAAPAPSKSEITTDVYVSYP